MDAATVDLVLDALESELETYPKEGTLHTIPRLNRQLSLLASLSRHELLTRFEARADSRLEALVADRACAWVNQQPEVLARELHEAHRVLLKIGGSGLTQLINCELTHPDYLTRLNGLRWACMRADVETKQHVQTIVASDHLRGNPPFPVEQCLAIHALAALGDGAAVIASMLRWGEQAFDTAAEMRRRQPPIADAHLKPALAALEEQNEPRRAHAILALGLSGRQVFIPRLRAILIQAPAESELALAAMRALEQLQGHRETLPALLLALDARRVIPILCNHMPKEMKTLTRWAIGRALRFVHPAHPVSTHLQEMLESAETTVRAAGAALSGWQEDSGLQLQLGQLLEDDVSETVHHAALEALERQRNAQEVQRLMAAFPSANDSQRWSLLEAILSLGDPHLLGSSNDVLWLGTILEGVPVVCTAYAQKRLEKRFKEVEEEAQEKDREPSRTV